MLKNSCVVAITLVALIACGYSGPLYLPQNADKQAGATSKNQFAPTSLAQVEALLQINRCVNHYYQQPLFLNQLILNL